MPKDSNTPEATIKEYINWAKQNFKPEDIDNFNSWILSDKYNQDLKNQLEWPNWNKALRSVKSKTAEKIESLGDVAAENDTVLDYFLITNKVKDIQNQKISLVLGRKGTGKTAIVKYLTENKRFSDTSKSISMDNYPWTITHGDYTNQKLIQVYRKSRLTSPPGSI